jgi:pyruvate/2-oxoglutarate dehydrogenase complex dihydrolipoamide acyltransferase (E2) component
VSPERPNTYKVNNLSSGSTSEQASREQEYEADLGTNENKQLDPDVILDIPLLKVDEIDLDVEDLRAQVSLRAELADLVKVNIGVEVQLGKIKLEVQGLEAQALLKVKLEGILNTIDRALNAVDRHPEILGGATRGTDRAGVGTSRIAQDSDQEAEWLTQPAEATEDQVAGAVEQTFGGRARTADEAEQTAGNLLGETGDEEGQIGWRAVEESGDITEADLIEPGGVAAEEATGNLADSHIEEEYVEDQGRVAGQALDRSGNGTEATLDEKGNVVDLNVPEKVEGQEAEDEDADEVEATDAARRKAQELGVRLSEVRGTGSGGRILVKDVKRAVG